MTEMECKFCGIHIDYNKDTKTATEVQTGNKHNCPNLNKDKPKGFPDKWVKKEFKNVDIDLEKNAMNSRIEKLEKMLATHDEAIRALVKEISFKKGTEAK